jgi:4-hydroxybenzoate polyprenyltransferase
VFCPKSSFLVTLGCAYWSDTECLEGDPRANLMRVAMTVEDGTAIVVAYVLVSMVLVIAFLLAAFGIGWFIGRLRERHRPPNF